MGETFNSEITLLDSVSNDTNNDRKKSKNRIFSGKRRQMPKTLRSADSDLNGTT